MGGAGPSKNAVASSSFSTSGSRIEIRRLERLDSRPFPLLDPGTCLRRVMYGTGRRPGLSFGMGLMDVYDVSSANWSKGR